MLSLAWPACSIAVQNSEASKGWAVPTHYNMHAQRMFRNLPSTATFFSSFTKAFLGVLWVPMRLLKPFGKAALGFGGICIRALIGVRGVSARGRPWEMDWSCSTAGNPILPVGLGLPKDTLRCVGYHGFCFHSKSCPEPFAAFGTCSRRQKTCCIGMCGNPAQAGNVGEDITKVSKTRSYSLCLQMA